ncbi:MAG: glycosyltransferase, partial [Terriglobus roseus]|nr:glycosyltransferase [Terriglobus roseus]
MIAMHILVLCFFPAFHPPASGGEQRLFHLYMSLPPEFQVTLLTSTDFGARREIINHSPNFCEHRFPKDQNWQDSYRSLNRLRLEGDLAGLAMALAIADPNCSYTQFARALAPNVDLIIHEFPYTSQIFSDGQFTHKEVYNSHNFENSLLGSIVSGPGLQEIWLKLFRLEKDLSRRVSKILATSEADADKFHFCYGIPRSKIGICPNGYDEKELRSIVTWRGTAVKSPARRPRVLFFGSAHPPNVEAAQA